MTTEPFWVRPGGRVEVCANAAAAPDRRAAARAVARRFLMAKSLTAACVRRHTPRSTRARFSSRAWQQFPTAVRTAPGHLAGTGGAEGAFVAADSRRVAVVGQGRRAALALGPHFQTHTCSLRRQACSLRRY